MHGAAGAVGAFGVQLAVARGATVVGTASPRNHDYLRSLGAIPVTYGDGLADRVRALAPQGVDAAFDVAGQAALDVSIELRGGTDRIVTITDLRAPRRGRPRRHASHRRARRSRRPARPRRGRSVLAPGTPGTAVFDIFRFQDGRSPSTGTPRRTCRRPPPTTTRCSDLRAPS